MSQINNIIIQVRARLHLLGIKLWLEPYYYDEVGCVETEIDKLADSFSYNLTISKSKCKFALTELQEGALRKLAAREEFATTGVASFSVRRISNTEGTQRIVDVKCALNALGSELQSVVAKSLDIVDPSRIKCISAGKIIDTERSLEIQNIKNNQEIMVIISELNSGAEQNAQDAMYDRIRNIKNDVESIVDSGRQLFEMEDQDGNSVFLPPEENRALLKALGYYEKARAAMKHDRYDEALVLLLEADGQFFMCNSRYLESIDNYALVNLDIVWCYLCLKNVTQLPDAQRRLELCEKSFQRSYGANFERLITLKGTACAEKALIIRLHLLQGVVLFHQNNRNDAYEKFVMAQTELESLKVDDNLLASLVEMGYETSEARLALRSSGGNLEQAINFIHEQKEKLKQSRKKSKKERQIHEKLSTNNTDADWVNPRSVCTLMEMNFERDVAVEALKRCNNDVPKALALLETSANELRLNLPPAAPVDDGIVSQLQQLGFNEDVARVALETRANSLGGALDSLITSYDSETDLRTAITNMTAAGTGTASDIFDGPSTSSRANWILTNALQKAQQTLESLKAYNRFKEDITDNEQDYLDLPLVQEEQIIAEYKNLLQQ